MIVFLDIDGVLNSRAWFSSPLRKLQKNYKTEMSSYINPRNLFWVSLFCKLTKAKVVLSTSWRYGWDDEGKVRKDHLGRSVELTDKLLKKHGLDIISVTPDISSLTDEYNIDWSVVPESFLLFTDAEKNEASIDKNKFIKYARGSQILTWIESHNCNDNFLIFDDDVSDIICFEVLKPHVIKTSFYGKLAGFGLRHFIRAYKQR